MHARNMRYCNRDVLLGESSQQPDYLRKWHERRHVQFSGTSCRWRLLQGFRSFGREDKYFLFFSFGPSVCKGESKNGT